MKINRKVNYRLRRWIGWPTTVDPATDELTVTGVRIEDGMHITFHTDGDAWEHTDLPAPLKPDTTYYVVNSSVVS